MKKFLSLFTALSMVLGLVVMPAKAVESVVTTVEQINDAITNGEKVIHIADDTTSTGFAKGNAIGNTLWNNKVANSGSVGSKKYDIIIDGIYAIRDGEVPTYTASINNKNYETLTDAINAANPGDTVELLDNVVLTKKDSTGNVNIVIDKSLTIDGNGYKVSSSTAKANFRIFAEVVETIKEEDVKDNTVKLIVETAKGAEVVQYLDLSVLVSVVVNDEVKATSEVTELTKPMTFTIAVPEEIAEVETPNTGDNSFVTLFATMTVLSLAAFLFLKRKEELN